jgi:hypothetical protein
MDNLFVVILVLLLAAVHGQPPCPNAIYAYATCIDSNRGTCRASLQKTSLAWRLPMLWTPSRSAVLPTYQLQSANVLLDLWLLGNSGQYEVRFEHRYDDGL